MRRIALFGGSFDPPHVGHVLTVAWVLASQPFDRFLVVPAFDHSFAKKLTPFPHRRRMTELAFADLGRVEVSDIEAQLGGASYTVRTLEHIQRTHPGWEVCFVIGSDLVDQIPSWHQGHRIPELATVVVVGRGGHEDGHHDLLMPEVSSTDLRARLHAGESTDGLLPFRVARYVERYGLYRAPTAPTDP